MTKERKKNDEERPRNWSRKRPRSASTLIFSFFLLLLTNLKWIMDTQGAGPFLSASHAPFIAKIGEKLAAQLAQASWLLRDEVS